MILTDRLPLPPPSQKFSLISPDGVLAIINTPEWRGVFWKKTVITPARAQSRSLNQETRGYTTGQRYTSETSYFYPFPPPVRTIHKVMAPTAFWGPNDNLACCKLSYMSQKFDHRHHHFEFTQQPGRFYVTQENLTNLAMVSTNRIASNFSLQYHPQNHTQGSQEKRKLSRIIEAPDC